ncbi:MAG: hypothetical protein C4617_04425 [Candidatus Liberibacter europaeus]|uniref:Uncharacterized protein n=1 Tax=Candidatus Liberibacter europaeus TaxID=744859 RepID=A0A2T4VWV4_9HYPH|nr:hypothetical protein [Candidatus Liberibacter europaeus]PTL86257.1 MAG: hypothetical protein C4617_04425 [Candidatus Liberibacter europaeus]
MSGVLTFSTNYIQTPEEEAKTHGGVFYPQPSAFQGAGDALSKGVATGAEKLWRLLSDDWINTDKLSNPRTFNVDPRDAGVVSQFIGKVAEDISIFGAGFLSTGANPIGGLVTLGFAQGHDATEEYKRKGVDTSTARMVGANHGFWSAVEFSIPRPFKGLGLFGNIVSGSAQTAVGGILDRTSSSTLLRQFGHPEQAKLLEDWDYKTSMADAILGAFFGGLGHFTHGEGKHLDKDTPKASDFTPEDVEIALAIKKDARARQSTGDGIPTTPDAMYTKEKVQERAYNDLILDEPTELTPKEAKIIYDNSIAEGEPETPEFLEKYKEKDRVEVKEEPAQLLHDIEAPTTEISEFVPDGDLSLARFEKTHPEEAKVLREEISSKIEELKEWKTLLNEAVECHFS